VSKNGYRELTVWQKSRDLAVSVYRTTTLITAAHDYSLADQIRRSAVSIPSNVAEGDERHTDREAVRFFYIAKGSLAELRTQLELAHLVGYLDLQQWQELESACALVGRMLGSLIKVRSSTYRP
jgi:four helix bundle protein